MHRHVGKGYCEIDMYHMTGFKWPRLEAKTLFYSRLSVKSIATRILNLHGLKGINLPFPTYKESAADD